MAIDAYTNLITSEHKTKPNFMAWLSSALTLVDDNITITNEIPSNFDIDLAEGVQLDVLGVQVGRSRVLNFQPSDGSHPTLDDTNYRIALKAKIAQNQWDGTIPEIYSIWDSLFPDITLNIVDNQDMTMSVLIDGQLDAIITEMVSLGYIVPKPQGVRVTIIEVQDVSSEPYVGALVTGTEFITVSTITP